MCDFCVVKDGMVKVEIGDDIIVKENVQVSINCTTLVEPRLVEEDFVPVISWFKDELPITNGTNIMISENSFVCIIVDTILAAGGQVGTAGVYECVVCNNASIPDCISRKSNKTVCGE